MSYAVNGNEIRHTNWE